MMAGKVDEELDGYQSIEIRNAVAANIKSLLYVFIFDLALCIIFRFWQVLGPLLALSLLPACLNVAYLMLASRDLQKRIYQGNDWGIMALYIYFSAVVVVALVCLVWVFVQLCLFNYDDLYPYVAE